MVAQDRSVVGCRGHQQDKPPKTTVAKLRLTTPLESLHVVQSRLGVNGNEHANVEYDIPSPQVSVPPDRDLAAPPDGVWHLPPEAS
jgi:hypothetical protein